MTDADAGASATAGATANEPPLLIHDGFDPRVERGVEAAFSVANGTFGVRAAVEEGSLASYPLVLVSGVYVPTPLAASQTLLAIDDPACVGLSIDGELIQIPLVESIAHRRTLDAESGTAARAWSFRDRRGRRWRLESLRAASAIDPPSYLHRLSLTLEDGGAATISLGLPGAQAFDQPLRAADDATVIVAEKDAPPLGTVQTVHRLRGTWAVGQDRAQASVTAAAPLLMESVTRICASGEAKAGDEAFDAMLARHRQARAERWADADIVVEGDDELQTAVRFALHHLISAASVDDGRSSIGARNLSGEAYHGHVFWDTEIFILPALMFSYPEAVRSCLLYRHRTLDAARARARSLGFAGALYAWESTDTGEDRTPASAVLPDGSTLRILTGEQEHHISADVPYAVMQYWGASGDDAFMLGFGAEIVFECARFWNSRVTLADHHHAIRKVIGPDEYHEGVDDDGYTNAMAAWTLRVAAALPGELSRTDASATQSLLRRLAISAAEIADWGATSSRIARSSFHEPRVVEQFDGFFGLRPIDVRAYRRAGVPIDIAMGFNAMQDIRAIKQADVLLSAALLPEIWDEDALRMNVEYYEPLTAHTSSLSPPTHALLAARLRDGGRCRTYLDETMRIDMGDYSGAAGGVHLAAQGGLWQAVVFGLAGFAYTPDGVAFDPFLLPPLRALSFALRWRGRRIRVRIVSEGRLTIDVEGAATTVRVNDVQRQVVGSTAFAFDPSMTFWSARRLGGAHGL
jgi:trehalose/maltose hydrolase-like predicted phosphorylase